MENDFHLAAMLPTAGYLFAEELDAHFLAVDDFHSMLLQDDYAKVSVVDTSFSLTGLSPSIAPNSPSSVINLPPYYPSPDNCFIESEAFVKQEPLQFDYHTEEALFKQILKPVKLHDVVSDDDKERLRRRQRGYEKRYRGRKRVSVASFWLKLKKI